MFVWAFVSIFDLHVEHIQQMNCRHDVGQAVCLIYNKMQFLIWQYHAQSMGADTLSLPVITLV